MKRLSLIIILGLLFICPTYGHSVCSASFSDTHCHWAETYINNISVLGIMNGYPDGTFRPDNAMSRAEFISALLAAQQVRPFYQISSGHWAQQYINEAIRQGIIIPSEYPYGFDPNQPITRAESSAFVARALNYSPDYSSIYFTDWKQVKQSPYSAYINIVHKQGLITGYPNGEFKPFSNITRAQACIILQRLLINSPVSSYTKDPWNNSYGTPSNVIETLEYDGYRYNPSYVAVYHDYKITDYYLDDIYIINNSTVKLGNKTYDLNNDDLGIVLQGDYYSIQKITYSGGTTSISIAYDSHFKEDVWQDLDLDDIYAVYDDEGNRIKNIEDIQFRIGNSGTRYDLDEVVLYPDDDKVEIDGHKYSSVRIDIIVERSNGSRVYADIDDIRVSHDQIILDCDDDYEED